MPGKGANVRLEEAGKPAAVTPGQVRQLRLQAQHLYQKTSAEDLVEVVRSLGGVNAQFSPAMMLSLCARIKGLQQDDIRNAIVKRQLVRTWVMRGTIHLIDPDDLGWLVSLLGPAILPKDSGRRLELGLDDAVIRRGLDAIMAVLDGEKPPTRDKLVAGLIDRGILLERKSQAPYHLIVYAALKGLVCLGPDRENGDQTYCLAKQWIGERKIRSGDDALAELVSRYLNGCGAASPQDFSAWSGLGVADARKAWTLAGVGETLREIGVEDRILWWLEPQYKSPGNPAHVRTVVNLLPAFDPLVLGYADRELIVSRKYQKEIYHGGQTVPVVLVDGLAAGVWRYARHGKKRDIRIAPFEPFERSARDCLEKEAEDIGRFFGQQTSLDYRAPGQPL
jgi:hypothetical protein